MLVPPTAFQELQEEARHRRDPNSERLSEAEEGSPTSARLAFWRRRRAYRQNQCASA